MIEPAGSVQPRYQLEAERLGVHGSQADPGACHQRTQTHARGLVQPVQAVLDEKSILPGQRTDVGYSAKSCQSHQVVGARAAHSLEQRLRQLEGGASAREVRVGVGGVAPRMAYQRACRR